VNVLKKECYNKKERIKKTNMQCVIFTGLPGCGKSTYFKERFFDTHIRVNLDMIKKRKREQELIEGIINARMPFVVDNTNITIKRRERYFKLLENKHYNILSVYFDIPLEICFERNKLREEKKRVPEFVIKQFANKIEKPTLHESFNTLEVIKY
jgi:predicted kinase